MRIVEKATRDISSNCRKKRLQGYDRLKKFFDQPIKHDLRTYDNIRKTPTGND